MILDPNQSALSIAWEILRANKLGRDYLGDAMAMAYVEIERRRMIAGWEAADKKLRFKRRQREQVASWDTTPAQAEALMIAGVITALEAAKASQPQYRERITASLMRAKLALAGANPARTKVGAAVGEGGFGGEHTTVKEMRRQRRLRKISAGLISESPGHRF